MLQLITASRAYSGVDSGISVSWLLYILPRVYEVERVLNRTYTSGEHHWESNVTFSVAHVSTTVSSLVLFYFASFSTHSSQQSSSTVAEAVDTVGCDSRFLQW